ncbi:DUF1592 domain-containing protein [Tautonia plasticadhaerens]|uniref:Planctomycete cytochrome C n=1 Tax=Tautonia plasticadhaerens TaxID=2527974 RepID=A0A518H3K2_9BACT|nr:DUF1592 domain-containing protein [Tautonia plasticadhaerens]QDV35434.1 hypothetical protein ElP_33370 [Tautonia plasticadhaerens]
MRNAAPWGALSWVASIVGIVPSPASADELGAELKPLLGRYCVECHGEEFAEAKINLQQMAEAPDLGRRFREWEKVARVVRDGRMPPEYMPQPARKTRETIAGAIEGALDQYVERHEGDPGPVPLRRLTGAEYAATIEDLTGVDLDLGADFVSDAVAGEGFTNAGGGQFMQDSTLERYLEAARRLADHLVVGSGPLRFFEDPGRTGRELSAITRIQAIYQAHGFRTAAGEGAEPFGLDLYPSALLVAWQYRHREELGLGDVDLPTLARREGRSVRLCEHLWRVLNREEAPFPLSLVIDEWRALPPPGELGPEEARARCLGICERLRGWQSTLAASAGDEEEAAVLTAGEIRVAPRHEMAADISWPEGARSTEFVLSVSPASDHPIEDAVVLWRDARIRLRLEDRRRDRPRSIAEFLDPESADRLAIGSHPRGGPIDEGDFAIGGGASVPVRLRIPEGAISARLTVEVELDEESREFGIVRCRVADGEVEGETAAEVGDTSALLADPGNPLVESWREGVAEFARLLPEVSHREPAPSDRDPIPAPFDAAYNMPERNEFHSSIKYHRDDDFFVRHVADDAARLRLDRAWTDLLSSFEYHDLNLRFLSRKFGLGLDDASIDSLDAGTIEAIPEGPRAFVTRWKDELEGMRQALEDAEPGHVEDALRLAGLAWRRPLSSGEQGRLRSFYRELRAEAGLDHDRAIRALFARILVSPAFLYRAEPTPGDRPGVVPLDDWQLASRLSYFLWSSMPDEELRRLAAGGRLRDPGELARQARRMLSDPKAGRLASEFFGQWLGFYRFDRHRGIDTGAFPEFTERLRGSMYGEAEAFFGHLVREDRPVDEILFADYSFLDRRLAEHYGIPADSLREDEFARVDGLDTHHRGGLFGMGSVLAVTSAPLRTSAVKRGDWVLRRVVGTPVPPPPADVGSIPAEEVLPDGLTVRERLEAHRSDASCVNCHARIDPLGFALEQFDPLGRWRDSYADGQEIDTSGTLSDGTTITGPGGLRDYLRRERPRFHRTIGAKLLGYALGRAELVSDRPLVGRMVADLDAGGRFSDLVVRVVTSEQFRNRRSTPFEPPEGEASGGE